MVAHDAKSDSGPFLEVQPGFVLDRYDLVRQIGQGGMGAVWLGRLAGKHGFEKTFAIKLMSANHGSDDKFRQMFLDEARIASQIHHPNVAQIFDLGEQNGILYLVMEWIEGDSFQFILRMARSGRVELPLGVVLRILADASAGLHAAHELRGSEGEPLEVVHRDVSPHNVLVARTGVSKVIDFGIAKARNRLVGDTSTGSIKGKVRYMAPEQALGRRVDRRTDIWAVGAMLNEYLLGQPMYDGDNDISILQRLFRGEAPLIPREKTEPVLYDVLERTLRTDPDDRFATAAQLGAALEEAADKLNVAMNARAVAAFLDRGFGEHFAAQSEAVSRAVSSLNRTAHRRALAADLSSRGSSQPPVASDPQAAVIDDPTRTWFTRSKTKPAAVAPRKALRVGAPALLVATIFGAGSLIAVRATTSPTAASPLAPFEASSSGHASASQPEPKGASRDDSQLALPTITSAVPAIAQAAPTSSARALAAAARPAQRPARAPSARPATSSDAPVGVDPPSAAAPAISPHPATREPPRKPDDDEQIQ